MKLKYNLGLVLDNASDLSAGAWTSAQIDITVSDYEGVYDGTFILVGDYVIVDTGSYESGTITKYLVTSIVSKNSSTAKLNVSLVANDTAAPDLSYCVGSRGIVSRPSALGVLSVISPNIQQIVDKFSFYTNNENLSILESNLKEKNVSSITYDGSGKVLSFNLGSDAYSVTYGANGVSAITKNGSPYVNLTYNGSGQLTSVTYA